MADLVRRIQSVTAKPLSSEDDGRISGWRGVISDITESKTSHSALYKLAHRCPLGVAVGALPPRSPE